MRFIVALIIAGIFGGLEVASYDTGPRCPPLVLPNGRVRTRSRGKLARFSCYESYTLVGNRYSNCVRGKWDTPIPLCVSAQCTPPLLPEHSLIATKYNGAIAMFFCEPGFKLVGAAEIYCVGSKWNTTEPYCRDSQASAPTSCDFEKSDLCWWEQDPTHDFDWQRHNRHTPSSHIGTGPSHDHTLGAGREGYYLYIEASGRLVNDTARIVSPLYSANLTNSGCFSFWYHMYGATIGALNIYFKRESSPPQLMFTETGNHGNQWIPGIFDLPASNTSFQIIIEGVRGASYVSDVAIDDVAIYNGEQCETQKSRFSPKNESGGADDSIPTTPLSCRGRCTTENSDARMTTTPPKSSFIRWFSCRCDLECAENSACCPDYAEYCVLGVDYINVDGTTITTLPPTTITHGNPEAPIFIGPKDDIDPLAKIPETTMSPGKKIETLGTTPKPTRTSQQPTMKTTPQTKLTTVPRATPIGSRETPFPAVKTSPSLAHTPRTETTRIGSRVTQSSGIVKTLPSSTMAVSTEAQVHAEQATIQHLGTSMSLGVSGITAIVLIGSVIALTIIIAVVIVRKRKSYKRGRSGGGGSALSEDSDVRFLTSDEILDFNLARPSDYDE